MLRFFGNHLVRGVIALELLVGIGIAGYMVIEGWSLLDAAYMTILTFTTVGYEEVHPLSTGGRIFTIFLMIVGVGVMLYILTSVVNAAVAHEIVGLLVRRRRFRRRMSKLKGHYIICGYGRVGAAVASTLQESSTPLIVMDKSAEALAEAEEQGLLCLQGDATKDADLLTARVTEASGLLATAGEDSENVYISLTARGLNPDLRIVARASYPEAEEKLRRAGADEIVSPPTLGGRQMALSAIEAAR